MATVTLQPTDPFFQIFQRERQAIWERNQHLSDMDREALWYQRKAELASFIPSDSTHHHVQAAHTPRSLSHVPIVRSTTLFWLLVRPLTCAGPRYPHGYEPR